MCDKFAPNIDTQNDPYGITTQNDGIIHIHPYEKKYAGTNADLGLFAKAVDMKLDRDSVQLPGDGQTKFGPGTKCGDKEGELVVKEWTNAKDDTTGRIVQADPREIRLKDNAAITIAFVPKGEQNIPRPPTADTLDQVKAADQAAAAAAAAATTTTTPAAADSTATTAPGQTTTTAAAG